MMLENNDILIEKINKLRKEKNAITLAHYNQIPEIQEIADFVGDSLDLSRKSAETQAEIIVFAGVYFMAETAKILSPEKRVFIPDVNAGRYAYPKFDQQPKTTIMGQQKARQQRNVKKHQIS